MAAQNLMTEPELEIESRKEFKPFRVLFIVKKHNETIIQGILYLSAYLKSNGFIVDFLDTADFEEADTYVRDNRPDLLAYSCTSGEYPFYNDLNAQLKERYGIFSVVGGAHATFFGKTFMTYESTSFDGACFGEGEDALLELCQSLRDNQPYRRIANWVFKGDDSSTIFANDHRALITNLDKLPFPDFSIDKNIVVNGRLCVWLHRGCPFKCTYCMNHKYNELYKQFGDKVVRVASARYCIDLIKNALANAKQKAEHVKFEDDTFGGNLPWLREFCQLYKEEIGLPWDAHLYPKMITEDRVEVMARGGLRTVDFAIETGNEKRRRELLERPMSNEDIIVGARACHKYGLGIRVQNILLLPGETFATAWETFTLNCQCKPEISTASKFQPYPGMKLTEKAITMGLIKRGEFEHNIPDNFHWISILKWDNEKEVNKINNLLNLFTFGTYFTLLKPLVYLLVHLPNSKFHHHIDNTAWSVIAHRKDHEVIPSKWIKCKVFWRFVVAFLNPVNIQKTLKRKVCHKMNFSN